MWIRLHIRCDKRIKLIVPTWVLFSLVLLFHCEVVTSLVNKHLSCAHTLVTVFQDKMNQHHLFVHFQVKNSAFSFFFPAYKVVQTVSWAFSFASADMMLQANKHCRNWWVKIFVLSIFASSLMPFLHIFICQETPPLAHFHLWLLHKVFTTGLKLGPSIPVRLSDVLMFNFSLFLFLFYQLMYICPSCNIMLWYSVLYRVVVKGKAIPGRCPL